MAKIAVIYNAWRKPLALTDMGYIRWIKIAEALARCGHEVDILTNEPTWLKWWDSKKVIPMAPNLQRKPIGKAKWSDYDVIKTLFNIGFKTLEKYQGDQHPFIISKLGSVVGPREMPGIYFYGKTREDFYACQERISERCKYITVLTEKARELWIDCHGVEEKMLLVPGGVDHEIPDPGKNPFPATDEKICIFAGNVYNERSQPEANKVLIEKLNQLGKLLGNHGVRLYMFGPGDVSKLNTRYVTYKGVIPYEASWDYFHHADVGIVVSAGAFMHNNESTKIYHYLRAGLPYVSENGFPNDYLADASQLGYAVPSGDMPLMAEKIIAAANRSWDRDFAINYILDNHTWDKRAAVYDQLIRKSFG